MQNPVPNSDLPVMCLAHIEDTDLLGQLQHVSSLAACTICGKVRQSGERNAALIANLASVVRRAVELKYDHEGFVIDDDHLSAPMTTTEVILITLDPSVDAVFSNQIVATVTAYFDLSETWYEKSTEYFDADIQFEWYDFEQSIKHESRLLAPALDGKPKTSPERNYAFVRSLLVFAEQRSGLIRTLKRGTKLYRARAERDVRALEEKITANPSRELGPAPSHSASAGRMNAQGISMFYVSQQVETACAEVASHSPYNEVVAGTFVLQQELRILDLTQVPPSRSVFNTDRAVGDERIQALNFYRERITQPVIHDHNHPVDYVPSQILTDAFRYWTNPPLDGIAFSSNVHEGGTNVVLFFGDPIWYETDGISAPRLARFLREDKRKRPGPLFVIRPDTVRRYKVERTIRVRNRRRQTL